MKYLKCNNLPIYDNIFLATNYIPSKTSKTETRTKTKTKQEATAHDHDRKPQYFKFYQTLWNVECVGSEIIYVTKCLTMYNLYNLPTL